MFSGKSEELIRRLRRAEGLARLVAVEVQIFKAGPIDERYAADMKSFSHSGLGIQSESV